MPARDELLAAYQQWREITITEGEAIQTEHWLKVSICQEAKKRLQVQIIKLIDRAQASLVDAGSNPDELLQEIRPIVQELIQMESRNGELLANQMVLARERMRELGADRHNLRRIKTSYQQTLAAQWQSYS